MKLLQQLLEISKETKDRYVKRAASEHSMASMAKRNADKKDKPYWDRMERNRRKGISRALKDKGDE